MYTGLLHLHNLLRWVILLLLLIGIVQGLMKHKGLAKTSLFLLIAAHISLLIGIYQWFAGNMGWQMKNPAARFWVVEHFVGMLLGITLITIARGKAKILLYKPVLLLYVVALIIILASVPWPFREGIGRGLLP
jgi:uncharacterized membrane protein